MYEKKTEFIICLFIYSTNIMITIYLLEALNILGLEQHTRSNKCLPLEILESNQWNTELQKSTMIWCQM